MNHAQDLDLLLKQPIRDNEGQPVDDKFACAFDPALTTQVRIALKDPYIVTNRGKHPSRRGRVVTGNEIVDFRQVQKRASRITDFQTLGPTRSS